MSGDQSDQSDQGGLDNQGDLDAKARRRSKPLVYVAGPISGNPFGCVRESMPVFEALRELGAVPFMPQWSVLAEMTTPQPYESWMDYDLDVIARCDALVRLPGESPGADREVEYALAWDIPSVLLPPLIRFTKPGGELDRLALKNLITVKLHPLFRGD